jgi:hypothetical protein
MATKMAQKKTGRGKKGAKPAPKKAAKVGKARVGGSSG